MSGSSGPAKRRASAALAGAPRWTVGVAFVLLFAALAWIGAARVPVLAKLEAIAYDARLSLARETGIDPKVVLVDIDEASLARIGRWPWSRDALARLTAILLDRHGARLVAFDVLFPEEDRSGNAAGLAALASRLRPDTPESRSALAEALAAADHDRRFAAALAGRPTVLACAFTADPRTTGVLPPPAFTESSLAGRRIPIAPEPGYTGNLAALQRSAAAAGHLDPAFDADGVVRRVPMLKRHGDGYYPALSLAIAALAVDAKAILPVFDDQGDLVALDAGGLAVPVSRDGLALVPYRAAPGSHRAYSAADVLEERVAADAFPGAIVLVGASAKGLADLRSTPLAPDLPGVEIHASLVTGMLDGALRSVPAGAREIEALILAGAGLIAVFAIPWRRPLAGMAAVVLLAAIVVGANLGFWFGQNAVVPLAPTLALLAVLAVWNLFAGFVRQARETRVLAEMFGEYVPRERVEQMSTSGERFSLDSESRELSVLFCDIRDFTTVSERLPPRELSALLNDYLSSMTSLIHERRGTIDKYVGDAIMAFWGAPVANAAHATDAVAAALAMQRAMPALHAAYEARGWPPLATGIGVNTGAMSVGDMGSRFRKAYTVLGDAVNLASRLEGLTKVYGVPILCGEATRASAPGYVWREVDRVRVKGRSQAVSVHEPLGAGDDAAAAARAARWAEALACYRDRRFDEARAAFDAIAAEGTDRAIASLFAARCATLAAGAPPPGWDGAWTYGEK